MKKGFFVALALLLIMGGVLPCLADDAPASGDGGKMTLRFACHVPQSPATTFAKYVLDEVTKRTNGRITWQTYWGGQPH